VSTSHGVQTHKLSIGSVKKRLRDEARAYAESQQGVTRCVCGWYWAGVFGKGRQAFLAHKKRCKA
jgi:hypothetical protein